ncbi:MAG: RNA methyltransferase [SAR324 cluster bacterium]|nr:RNA methyltransferase [SAR324 cluster bacterium]
MRRPRSLPALDDHDRFRVVLVEPGDSLNVGAVARAMMNLGFGSLHLVAPPRYDPSTAAITACWAKEILEGATIHDTLEEALAPMEQVVGFTARHGKNRPRHLLLAEWCERIEREPPRSTALLFGSEDSGLRRNHLAHCHWLVRIPSSEANPSYNLAQAVLLALFEVSRPRWGAAEGEARGRPPAREVYQLETLVEEVLTRARFYRLGNPEVIRGMVKHLLRRMDPDPREMRVMLGMFGKINRALQGIVPVAGVRKERKKRALQTQGTSGRKNAAGS